MSLTLSRGRVLLLAVFAAAAGATILLLAAARGPTPEAATAASHREAPAISLDPAADITDFFMFRSYESGQADKVVLIMDVMSEEPSSGPNYWNFDPSAVYRFNVDNDLDGKADDVVFEFRFKTEFRGIVDDLDLFLSYVALPPITALDGPGSEGLGLRQTYDVLMIEGDKKTKLADDLIAVPSNVGPRTMPDYGALAAQGVYNIPGGGRVFVGQRDDPFYIDLGAVFDTLNLRSPGTDMLSGFNVSTIALELPTTWLTGDTGTDAIGAYASTLRSRVLVGSTRPADLGQVQRLANPLVNEAIIPTELKDRWNRKVPQGESDFVEYYEDPRLATALEVVFGADTPDPPRTDLRDLLLTYPGGDGRLSELLRLDVDVLPTPLASQNRLTVLAGDPAGWPNGRRPIDDVTDIAIKVVGGPNYAGAGDSVDANDRPLPDTFPFLSTPWDGRNRFHENP